jgi:SRSO17 transposase
MDILNEVKLWDLKTTRKSVLNNSDIKNTIKILEEVFERYAFCFKTKTKNVVDKAKKYVEGKLLAKGKGNMVEYSNLVPNTNDQELQHCISNSPWNYKAVTTKLQTDVPKIIGNKNKNSIHIDESSFPKQGNDSVGVASQYCGRLGKIANCQVGVFLGYVGGNYRAMLNGRLFIPEECFNDKDLLKKWGVPDEVKFKKKAELGIELITEAIENEVPFAWIGADSFYGRDPEFRKGIDDLKKIYIAEIPCDIRAWTEKPLVAVPKRNGFRGRFPIKVKVIGDKAKPIEVREIANNIPQTGWQHCFVRDTVRGRLEIDVAALRVHVVENNLPGKEEWLIIRKDIGKNSKVTDTKYYLSNAPADTPIEYLAEMACSRYWIERAFEDAKGICGLADYRVRSWNAWHHHMALTFLAMFVILMLNIRIGGHVPGLTVQDVKIILEKILPRKTFNKEDVRRLIEQRIKKKESYMGIIS